MGRRTERLGGYLLGAEIASGGTATVYVGRPSDAFGPGTAIAIKRLHRHLAQIPEFVAALKDEARIAARISHVNVVRTLEVVSVGDETLLTMELVVGASLAELWPQQRSARDTPAPLPITRAVVVDILRGLGAAHRATDELGSALALVHRDVSPQNIIIARSGSARLLDFGVARATGRLQATTEDGRIKGKVAYMAPEQVLDLELTPRTDLYAMGVVLWELLTGRRLYELEDKARVLFLVANGAVRSVRDVRPGVAEDLAAIVERALSRSPEARFASAEEMAAAVEATGEVASPAEVAEWTASLLGERLDARARNVDEIERAEAASAAMARESIPEAPVTVGAPTETLIVGAPASKRLATRRLAVLLAFAAVAAVAAVASLMLFRVARTAVGPETAAASLSLGTPAAPSATSLGILAETASASTNSASPPTATPREGASNTARQARGATPPLPKGRAPRKPSPSASVTSGELYERY